MKRGVSEKEESLVGRWAVCSQGRVGKIEDRKVLEWGPSWVGVGLDGRPWASRQPMVIAESDAILLASIPMKYLYLDALLAIGREKCGVLE